MTLTALALTLGIIGGSPSAAGADDAVVCITADTLPVCTGVLVGAHTVLSAGHCAWSVGHGVSYFVTVGPDCKHPSQRLAVADMITHPSYSGEGKPFDLALVKLASDVTGVVPLALSSTALDATIVGTTLRHVGFGASHESPLDGWGTRRSVSHAVLRLDGDFVWSGDAAANTCSGDSGGPALRDEQGTERVIAIVSDGPDCHSASADARVDVSRGWIDATLASWEPPAATAPAHGCSASSSTLSLALALLSVARRRRDTLGE